MTTKQYVTERDVVIELLQRFRTFECLWNPSDELYTHKDTRRRAINSLLDIWKKYHPEATVNDVKKKLEHSRTTYRRERKKVEISKESLSDPVDWYKPNLWYYKYLTFLDDETNNDPLVRLSSGHEDEDEETPRRRSIKRRRSDYRERLLVKNEQSTDSEPENVPSESEEWVDQFTEVNVSRRSKRKKNENRVSYLECVQNSAVAFGKSIACQLKELSKMQRCLAEKLMSDVLFYAKTDQLTLDTAVHLNVTDAVSQSSQTDDFQSSSDEKKSSGSPGKSLYLILPKH